MPTLHQSTEETKKILLYGGGGLGALLLIIFIFNTGKAIYNHFFPPPPPPPAMQFGKLPPISFPSNDYTSKINYNINTVTGTLPTFPDREIIYAIQQPQPNLLSFSNIQQIVNGSEFANLPATPLSDTEYVWAQTNPPYKKLTFDTLTYNFTLLSQYNVDPDVLSASNIGDQNSAIETAKTFLQNFNSLPTDIDDNQTVTTLYAINNGLLIPASSLSTTQVIRVDFYQKQYNNLPIMYPHPPYSTINAIIGSSSNSLQIVEAHYLGKKILANENSTYPIKTAQQAFQDLQNGKGYIASYNGQGGNVTITDISLAYYAGEGQQLFLEPIVVFQGNNNFIAYVSALSNSVINQ